MASFRDAEPPVRVALFFLMLLLSPGSAQIGNYTTLGKLLEAFQAGAKPGTGPGGKFAELFKGFSLTPFRAADPANPPPGLQSFTIPQFSQFSGSLPGIFTSPLNAITPEPLAPEIQGLLRTVGAMPGPGPGGPGGPGGDYYYQNGDYVQGGDYAMQQPTAEEIAEAVAILALLSGIFNLVAAILYIVSGGLATMAASLALIPATLALFTGPLSFFLALDSFAMTLRSDLQSEADNLYTQWTTALSNLATKLGEINNGTLRSQLVSLRGQLADVQDMLGSVGKYNITLT